ncbi:hypothetical protein [Dechloromonas sp.]|uniref:hypothetical protein n=1 Tax=Dechloromonas sp. TaxID=1917218 RepID=UPI00216DDF3D|nr:hypothetical protein [Dechloromonas sp.]MBU3696766.1 hypothetical protein [Dechloromonas sp.]
MIENYPSWLGSLKTAGLLQGIGLTFGLMSFLIFEADKTLFLGAFCFAVFLFIKGGRLEEAALKKAPPIFYKKQ